MNYRRRGVVLLLVLIVITILAMATLSFAELMIEEHRAALTASRQSQARVFAESGVEKARQILDRDPTEIQTLGGLYDNAAEFSNKVVADEKSPHDQGHFTIVAPKIEDTAVEGPRYGLEDESTRINLAWILTYDKSSGSASSDGDDATDNTNAHAMLMALPGMTDTVADCILDWIDADDTQRENGNESEYYNSLQPAYSPRNAPPTTIDELLLVPGVTPELLFGYDAVKMGYSTSDAVTAAVSGVATDGSMDHGWAQYLTLWSAESVLASDGSPKVNVNQSDMSALYTQLSAVMDPTWAEFIVAYRLGGGTASGSGLDPSSLSSAKARNTLSSPLDLIGTPATIQLAPENGTGQGPTLTNPFSSDVSAMTDYLPILFDKCTFISGKGIPGRININQASRIVIMAIPGMTSDMADQIIGMRQPDPATSTGQADRTCPAWPLIEGLVPLAEMKTMLPYITAGGSVYRAQIIGQFDKGNPAARLEVIIDATQHPARVLFWKDVSHLSSFPGEVSGGTASQP